MRIVKEIPHPNCKITVFSWNDKYIIKFEKGHLEQTYKIKEMDLFEEDNLTQIIESIVDKVVDRFSEMMSDLNNALNDIE